MKNKVKIVHGQRPLTDDALRFQKEARIVYEKRVKPQIKKAASTVLPKQVTVCNKPV